MTKSGFTKGLHDLGSGTWAYLQPDGSWGWNNAGLIVDGDQSLLVDTLFDEHLTLHMLDAIRDATGLTPADIGTLVNTHANGDHTFGNHLVTRAKIIASRASAKEMKDVPPTMLADMMRAAPTMGELGDYLLKIFSPFDFAGVTLTLPTRTFSGALELKVGDKSVQLIEVGPAHTRGDILVQVPANRVVYTGDILFIDGTPIMWAGPVENWLRACDLIMGMDVDTIVPGHGPLTDKAGVQRVKDYLQYVDAETRKRFDAGLDVEDAAQDIALDDFSTWSDAERIAVNVDTLYKGYRGDTSPPDIPRLFALMAKLAR